MKSIVTISRHWKNPKITTSISTDGIAIQMSMEDFVTALKEEIGSVTWVVMQKTFSERLDAAVEKVISGMKQETVKVMGG